MSEKSCLVCGDGCKNIELPGLIGHQTVLMYCVDKGLQEWMTERFPEDVDEKVLTERTAEIKKEFGNQVVVMVSRHDPVFDWID